MARFFDSSRDTGTVIRKAAQAAFGFANPGMADAGTPATFGQRLSSGMQAMGSESIPDFVAGRDASDLSSAQTNKAAGEAQKLRAEQKALETPFDMQGLIGGADETGTLFPAIQKIFDSNGVDMDGNGVTTQKEVMEAIDDGRLDLREVSDAIGESVKKLNANAQVSAGTIKEGLAKLNLRLGLSGENRITERSFAENPELAKTDGKLAAMIQTSADSKQKIKALQGTQASMASDIRQQTRGQSQQEIKNRFLSRPEVQAALTQADQLIAEIVANGGSKNFEGQTFTKQNIIDKVEAMFPEISGEIRRRLGATNVTATESLPMIDTSQLLQ